MRKNQIYIQFSIALAIALSSCSSFKYLEKKGAIGPNDYLLYKQNISGNKAEPKDIFTPFYQQKPNKKLPLLGSRPYFYFYVLGKSFNYTNRVGLKMERVTKKYDAKILADSGKTERIKKLTLKKEKKLEKLRSKQQEGNAFMRTFGEAPSIAKKENFEKSANMMGQMLKTKGYYHHSILVEYDTNGRKLEVTYKINEGEPHTINSIKYSVLNPTVSALIQQDKEESTLKFNKKLDESDLVKERDRLDKLLKNNGYFDFEKQFIFCKIDTNSVPYRADVEIILDTATGKDLYRKYTLNKIYCFIEHSKFEKLQRDTILYDKINFIQINNKFGKKVLAGKIKFRPGDYFSLDKNISTQLNLTNLDNFKFIDIKYAKLKPEDSLLNVLITLNSNKKFQITDEWGLNVSQGLPGPQVSVSFLDRNVLRGCENFDASVRFGIEGVASATNPNSVYKSIEGAADVGITFPQFYFPTRIRLKFNNYYPRTRLSFSFNNIVRPDYLRRNYKLALNYTFTRNVYSRYIVSIADLNVVQSTIYTKTFRDYLDTLTNRGNTLSTSFRPSFISSIHITYIYNNNDFTKFANGNFLRLFAETGGNLINYLEKPLEQRGIIQDKKLFGQLTYFKFVKFNIDYRAYRVLVPKSQLAFRVNTGLAYPFQNQSLPYEKYFFAGGSNSLRAWRPRRLGPGSKQPSVPNADGVFDYRFEQPAEIILELSVESRFKIIRFIEGAVFVDAGNVWRVGESLESPKASDFNSKRFYKEIAVGTGFGLRFNFSFIIVRFDLGLKVYDPALAENNRLVVKNWTLNNIIGRNEYGLINLGIGYPF